MRNLRSVRIIAVERHRIDAWLKHVCLFRQRGDATEACRGGHVKINGERAKPSANVKPGDVVEFLSGDHPRRVVVSVVPEKQAAREAARAMYVDESPPPPPRQYLPQTIRDRGAGRPTKRDRREIEKLRR
ncbi:MAG TPA: S4 domain-containing protein [Thermoanaerobaculia bacterium]|nr:S4 domain-containing protein [Thermoanaerobaculia bacterium]